MLLLVAPSRTRDEQILINEEYAKSFKVCNETEYETCVPQMQHAVKKNSEKLDKELVAEIKEMASVNKGRKYSKFVSNESDDSIEIPKIKISRNKNQRKKGKLQIKQ